jgi:serine-type D-Ala-D-Ala endopeptidase (penicillin-binding protein 7)
MIQSSIRWARRAAAIVSMGVAAGLMLGAPVQAAQQKRPVKTAKQVAQKQAAQVQRKAVLNKKSPTVTAKQSRSAGPSVVLRNKPLAVSAAAVSAGTAAGLAFSRDASTPIHLNSNVALVMDQNTHEVLLSKNDKAVLPIASLTKLMTGLLIDDAKLSLDEEITITQEDVDTLKGSSSRLAVGTRLTRGEAMHLALMSSENRAAHALGRTYPGGLQHFVRLMNQKAAELGMRNTRYVEPTGLSSENQSSAQDLARLVSVAYQRPLLRDLSTSTGYEVTSGRRVLQYRNTNRLIDKDDWNIGLQKTGYISEAGRCLVMQVNMAGRQLIMVFLDAAGKAARLGDAEKVRHWLESSSDRIGEYRNRG